MSFQNPDNRNISIGIYCARICRAPLLLKRDVLWLEPWMIYRIVRRLFPRNFQMARWPVSVVVQLPHIIRMVSLDMVCQFPCRKPAIFRPTTKLALSWVIHSEQNSDVVVTVFTVAVTTTFFNQGIFMISKRFLALITFLFPGSPHRWEGEGGVPLFRRGAQLLRGCCLVDAVCFSFFCSFLGSRRSLCYIFSSILGFLNVTFFYCKYFFKDLMSPLQQINEL